MSNCVFLYWKERSVVKTSRQLEVTDQLGKLVQPAKHSEPHNTATMPSYSYETTMTTTSSSSSSSRAKSESRCSSVSSELDEEFYSGLNLSDRERLRLAREFYYPPHIAFSGNYYPRYKTRGDSHTGTSHVSYLSRPYYSYLVPSRYSGYSKYVYITKIN